MKLLVLVLFWAWAIGAAASLACIAVVDYPRMVKYERWQDALRLAFLVGLAVWAGVVLWT